VKVRRREELVVCDDAERRHGRELREQAHRHGDSGNHAQPEQADVERPWQLRIPGRVRLVEGVPVDLTMRGVADERPQMHQHDRSDEHPQQRRCAHAHPAAEQLVETSEEPLPAATCSDGGCGQRDSSRSSLRSTTIRGSSRLCQ
jgi:hypothetical protein